MKRNFQRIMQIAFLALFIILFVKGKVQLWMGLFLFAIIVSFLLGRVYCGWICPINTVMKGVTWIKKKLHIKNIEISVFLTKPWVRFFTLGLFIAIFVLQWYLVKSYLFSCFIYHRHYFDFLFSRRTMAPILLPLWDDYEFSSIKSKTYHVY